MKNKLTLTTIVATLIFAGSFILTYATAPPPGLDTFDVSWISPNQTISATKLKSALQYLKDNGGGTSNFTTKLNVSGVSGWKARFGGPDGYIDIGPANDGWGHIYTDRSAIIFNKDVYTTSNAFSSYSNDLILKRRGTERLRIGSSVIKTGDISIGHTNEINTGGHTLYLQYRGGANNVQIGGIRNRYGLRSITHRADLSVAGDLWVLGKIHGTIDHSGDGKFSDKRLKKDITKIDNALGKLKKINGVYFYFKNKNDKDLPKGFEGGLPQEHQVGVIAQEVEKVLPEVVSTDEKGIKSVDYSKLTALLIEGMKEQQIQIEELKEQIKTQGEEIDKLREAN